jgi:hypothetical protein
MDYYLEETLHETINKEVITVTNDLKIDVEENIMIVKSDDYYDNGDLDTFERVVQKYIIEEGEGNILFQMIP